MLLLGGSPHGNRMTGGYDETTSGGLGALLVATDRIDEATSAFLEASRTAEATGDPLIAGAVEIYRAHLDRALGAAAEAASR